ncbi:tRNA-dihydrouridine synthase family protein [Candidatus Saccharibacteria bacterium]|nr:tRNA-dihydrouridine synthase family protein [Candidatus Saccharibacteria bacterium]
MHIWQQLPRPFLVLAPMEGVTDVIFRQVIARAGRPDLFFTEFTNVSSYASEKGRANALERLVVAPSDKPIVAQIWGKNPEHFAETTRALESLGFSGVDLNYGCPDKHVNKAGGGAAMIQNPSLATECFQNAVKSTNLPVSIKTRLGWSKLEEHQEWLTTLLNLHPAALTVHLRTKKEMSKVLAHYELIPEIVKLRAKISPETVLIVNGDIRDKAHALKLHQKYPEVDGFMIGRGVFANPYCFTDHSPTREELIKLLKLHLNLYEEYKKNHPSTPYDPLKHFFKIYINNFPGAKDIRTKLMETHSVEEAHQIIDQL